MTPATQSPALWVTETPKLKQIILESNFVLINAQMGTFIVLSKWAAKFLLFLVGG